jgi:hypothetical protein
MDRYEIMESPFQEVSWDPLNPDKVEKMWKNNTGRVIWEMTDGKLVAEKDGRIPANAVRLAAGVAGQIPEELARANGLVK